MHIILLHSTGGDPEESFFPWVEEQFLEKGHRVSAPAFPNSMEPDPKVVVPIILDLYDPDEETVFIGRSSGGTLIPYLLEQDAIRAKLAFSIAAPFTDLSWENLQQLFSQEPNFAKARSSVDHYFHWYSDDDPHVPLEHASLFQEQLGGEIRIFPGYSHFYNTEFPELVESVANFSEA